MTGNFFCYVKVQEGGSKFCEKTDESQVSDVVTQLEREINDESKTGLSLILSDSQK